MILSETGEFKLFSRCARSQCSRYMGRSRPSTAGPRLISSPVASKDLSAKKKNMNSFDMYESREQREKKYRPVATPPVGQYNPHK
jgi:hypothetical protein